MRKFSFQACILFENEDFLLINKPPFISSLAGNDPNDLNLLTEARKLYPTAKLCHRIDKGTSGALLFSKNDIFFKHIARQFENRQVKKHYHTVIYGVHHFSDLKIDFPINATNRDAVKIDFVNGKPSSTICNTLQTYNHYSLLECQPITGRLHQIRVHLAKMDCSIVGDKKYGGSDFFLSKVKRKYRPSSATEEEHPIIQRFALHSRKISFTDHQNKEWNFTADYPKDFRVLLEVLEKFDS